MAIFAGVYREVAARYANVHPSLLSRWMHMKGEPYETFQRWVHEAEAGAEIRAVQAITSKMLERPELAVTFLERKHPERWAKVVANPNTPINVNLNLTTMLERIEERANVARDPRTPREGRETIIEAMRGPVKEPVALPPHENGVQDNEEGETS